MTDDEIKQVRDNYNRIITTNNLLGKLDCSFREELEELEKDKKVQRYIYLKDIVDFHGNVDYSSSSDKEQINNAAFQYFQYIASNTTNSNKIYVFMGFFDRCENITVEKDKILYALFTDLETLDNVYISYDDYEKFKKDNKVITDDNEYRLHNVMYYKYQLLGIRKEFFSSLLDNDQEIAIQRILKK